MGQTLGFGWEIHVVPLDDRRVHTPSRTCWCDPRVEYRMVIHSSADHREYDEPLLPPLIDES